MARTAPFLRERTTNLSELKAIENMVANMHWATTVASVTLDRIFLLRFREFQLLLCPADPQLTVHDVVVVERIVKEYLPQGASISGIVPPADAAHRIGLKSSMAKRVWRISVTFDAKN